MTRDPADRYEVVRSLSEILPRFLFGDARHAAPPFIGYLEQPQPRRLSSRRPVRMSGWLFNRGSDLVRLTATLDGRGEVELQRGIARPDLESLFPLDPRARSAGFRGELSGAGTRLEVWAHLSSGHRQRAFSMELRPSAVGAARELFGKVARRRLRALFERNLLLAAGEQFPGVARRSEELFEHLSESWSELGGSWSVLEELLRGGRPSPPPLPPPGSTKRLLFVSGMFPSVLHGGGLRLFDLISELSARYEIDLYSVYREELDGPSLEKLKPRLHAARLVASDELRGEDAVSWLERLGRRPADYDGIHFEYPHSVPVIERLSPFGKRTFFTMMECLTLARMIDLERDSSDPGLAAIAFVKSFAVEREALARVHHRIAVTGVDADFALRCFGAPRATVVPTCVSDLEITRSLGADDFPRHPTALFVGYFDHYPNREALDWYFGGVHQRVLSKLPRYRLRVVGRGDLGPLQARWGGLDGVEWIGAVDSLVPHLRAARIGVAPVVSGAGIRGKINQYAVAGRPTVSTRIGSLGLPYADEESILIADSPEGFADKMVRLLSDDSLWRRLRAASSAIVAEHFSWPVVARRLEHLYAS